MLIKQLFTISMTNDSGILQQISVIYNISKQEILLYRDDTPIS